MRVPSMIAWLLSSQLAFAATHAAGATDEVMAGRFSANDLMGWESKVFNNPTDYRVVDLEGESVLQAVCSESASAFYRKLTVDLHKTPILRWRWRIDGVYPGLDETSKQGDDYPARIYVVIDGGALIWRTKALNYVWSSSKPAGSVWPNAYTSQAMMVAVRSGEAEGWHEESRDLRQDFQRLFGFNAEKVDGVALMTDCDDAKGKGRAWYGDIRFTTQ